MPSPIELAAWLLALFAVAGGVNQVLRLVDRLKEQPHPGSTYETIEHAKVERAHVEARLRKVEDDMRKLSSDIYVLGKTLAETGEARARRIHERIDGFRKELSDQITAMPSQVIVMLKNTGALDR